MSVAVIHLVAKSNNNEYTERQRAFGMSCIQDNFIVGPIAHHWAKSVLEKLTQYAYTAVSNFVFRHANLCLDNT